MSDHPGLTPADIIRQLWGCFQAGKPVRLMNAFRGVPVLHDATIMMLGQGNLALTVHPHQVLCIVMEKRTYLKSDMLSQVVRAYPVSTNVRQGEVVLARFAPARSSVGNRLSLHVQPHEPLRVILRTAQKETLATLADLSAKGVGCVLLCCSHR